MTQYKRLAIHNSACNDLFFLFQECEESHPYGRLFGSCSQLQKGFRDCIKEQRQIQRAENGRKAKERQDRLKAALQREAQEE